MLVPNQLVEVKIGSHTFKHYRELGYNVRKGDTILVPPNHLTNGSHATVDVICDVCKTLKSVPYKDYLTHHTYDMDVCAECSSEKIKKITIDKYGVDNVFQAAEIKDKIKNTLLDKYGYEHSSRVPLIKEKIKRTCRERYGGDGPMSSEAVREKSRNTCMERYGVELSQQADSVIDKRRQTCIEKYGVENPMQVECFYKKAMNTNIERYGVPYASQSEEFKRKVRNTLLERYGVENLLQHPEFRAKACASLYKNGTQKTSKPQIKLYEIIKQKHPNAELNYPYSACSLDVFVDIDGIKIDVEYDGYFYHQDQQRDIKRDKFLQSQGFKTLRVRSGHLLPTEQELFDAIDYLVNTEHRFKEIILSDWKEKEGEECQKQ